MTSQLSQRVVIREVDGFLFFEKLKLEAIAIFGASENELYQLVSLRLFNAYLFPSLELNLLVFKPFNRFFVLCGRHHAQHVLENEYLHGFSLAYS
jgi:hypothetical protein